MNFIRLQAAVLSTSASFWIFEEEVKIRKEKRKFDNTTEVIYQWWQWLLECCQETEIKFIYASPFFPPLSGYLFNVDGSKSIHLMRKREVWHKGFGLTAMKFTDRFGGLMHMKFLDGKSSDNPDNQNSDFFQQRDKLWYWRKTRNGTTHIVMQRPTSR